MAAPSLRFWLIDLPARITEVGYTWYRLYMLVILTVGSVMVWGTLITALVLWYVFGIRWGW